MISLCLSSHHILLLLLQLSVTLGPLLQGDTCLIVSDITCCLTLMTEKHSLRATGARATVTLQLNHAVQSSKIEPTVITTQGDFGWVTLDV